jgi:alanine racemase
VLLDAGPVAGQYGVRGIPCTFVIQGDGRIAVCHIGYRPGMERSLEDEVKKLLAGRPGRA